MFIDKLNLQQQGVFLYLCHQLISADGNIDEKEAELLALFKAQMAEGVKEEAHEKISDVFSSQESKAALLLELLGVAYANTEYHERERAFIASVAERVGVSKEMLAKMESWVIRQFALIEEAKQQFMEV